MANSDLSKSKRPWTLTFLGLLAIGGIVLLATFFGPSNKQEMPNLVKFFGRFHPVLLHLPIGVFSLIVIQELGSIFLKRTSEPKNTSIFPMFFGAASAILAVLAGLSLFHGDDYRGQALAERHLWGGIIFAIAAIVAFILKSWQVARGVNSAFYRVLLFGSVGLMGFTSHDGATITHGPTYLTEYAPEPVRNILNLPPVEGGDKKDEIKDGEGKAPDKTSVAADQSVYASVVQPIFERRCVQCHKESKSKGKYRMDTYELLVKGGKEGEGLIPGKSAESNIIKRVMLPKDDEEHMPPEGKTPLNEDEIEIIKWWIDAGADPKKAITELTVPEPIKAAIDKLAPAGAATSHSDTDTKSAAAHKGPDEKLKALVQSISKDFPGALGFESQDSALINFTATSPRARIDDATFKNFAPVTPQLVSVDLTSTKITDVAVAQLAEAKSLRLVRLSETAITDAAIDTLVKLPELESINLYGTKVTDAGISKFSAMPKLKRLFLWRTSVTPEAIRALKEKLPSCEVVTGNN
jgi:uncharacterized membrane protein